MADHPYQELNENRQLSANHAEMARDMAHQATVLLPDNEAEAKALATLSMSHSLAALATAVGGGGVVSIEDLGR